MNKIGDFKVEFTKSFDLLNFHNNLVAELKSYRNRIQSIYIEYEIKKTDSRYQHKFNEISKIRQFLLTVEEYESNVSDIVKSFTINRNNLLYSNPKVLLSIIDSYIDEASIYFNISIERPKSNNCVGCGIVPVSTANEQCSSCGMTIIKHIEKVPSSETAKDDDNLKTLLKMFRKFQGIDSDVNLPSDWRAKVDDYFRGKVFDRKVIVETRENKEFMVTIPGTSVAMMYEALKAKKLNKCYNDIHYICKLYWGWKLANLAAYQELVSYHYTETQKYYKDCKGTQNSNIRAWIRLWIILTVMYTLGNIKWRCEQSDFKPFSPATVEKYTEIAMRMYDMSVFGPKLRNAKK